VHVGDDDLPAAEVRALVGPDLIVGRTVRTAVDARAALSDGADHVGFGPVFASATKPLALAPRGLEALAEACAAVRPAPVVAVSGIDLANVAAVARAGAACAAVIGALYDAGSAAGATERARALAVEFARGAGERR
jgi:thiamine-phosphate pyrophosphorylase